MTGERNAFAAKRKEFALNVQSMAVLVEKARTLHARVAELEEVSSMKA